jgi:poly-gamma-glutamate capsule biosynthesis protein CapA/YwtB (metallophosphatase superfamily)
VSEHPAARPPTPSARVRRRRLQVALGVVLLVAVLFVGLRLAGGRSAGNASNQAITTPTASATPSPQPTAVTTSSAPTGRPVLVHLAFAGDIHFAGTSAAALHLGLGSGAAPLAKADLAVVNLETAVTNGGSQATKEFAFRAPPQALQVIKDAGIDAVSVANNHGEDYGQGGLADTLAASRQYGLPVIGAGTDQTAAFHGYLHTVRGVRVAVIAATDVLDSSLQSAWTAGPDTPGLASAKDGDLLAQRIHDVSASADVVVAFLHWGVEKQVCPTARQQALAAELVAAGADVVVGSHAHVLQPLGSVEGAPVAYGMGNFVFYGTSPAAIRSGVLQVDVRAVPGSGRSGHPTATTTWAPATIVSGRPVAVSSTSGNALPPLSAC